MDISEKCTSNVDAAQWRDVALIAFRSMPASCPSCQSKTVFAAWHVIEIKSREATVDLKCSACAASGTVEMELPPAVPGFFPLGRLPMATKAVEREVAALSDRIQRHAAAMPIAAFTTSPLWASARWSATTFRWHPKSEAPPVMGLVFGDAEAGKELFRGLEKAYNHMDRFEEMRISIIEGSPANMQFGYTVHICPEPEALAMHSTASDIVVDPYVAAFLGRWIRMYPIPGSRPLLPRFKEEFAKQGEFLLAPVTMRLDGQNYFSAELGFIKHAIEFRQLSDVAPDADPDASALAMPLILPPRMKP